MSRRWGDYTTVDSEREIKTYGDSQEEADHLGKVMGAEPILMLPLPSSSDWVLRKVAEVCRLRVSPSREWNIN